MSIEITAGGVTKTYRYYPYDAFYVDGVQVREAWFNGTKYYPDDYPNGIVAVRGIERHPAGVSHIMPSPRYAICSEVVNMGSIEIVQYPMGSYEISWAYLGELNRGNLSDVVIPQNGGGFQVAGGRISRDQYIARIKYIPNAVNRDELTAEGQDVFDKITSGVFLASNLAYRNYNGALLSSPNIIVYPDIFNFTDCKIMAKLDFNDGISFYNSHRYWTVHFYITTVLTNSEYIEGHERNVELFEPDNTSLLSASDLL